MRACDRRWPPHEELSERWINDTCTITRERRESRDHGQTQTRSYGERREATRLPQCFSTETDVNRHAPVACEAASTRLRRACARKAVQRTLEHAGRRGSGGLRVKKRALQRMTLIFLGRTRHGDLRHEKGGTPARHPGTLMRMARHTRPLARSKSLGAVLAQVRTSAYVVRKAGNLSTPCSVSYLELTY